MQKKPLTHYFIKLLLITCSFILSIGIVFAKFSEKEIIPPEIVAKNITADTEQTLMNSQQEDAKNDSILSYTQIFTTQQTQETTSTASQPSVDCSFVTKGNPIYSGKFVSIKKPDQVALGENFEITVMIKNTGNVPWFSIDSRCKGSIISLGTAKERDRTSPFYNFIQSNNAGWAATNRIKMDSKRVDPDQIASFIFVAKAPNIPGLYREFYAPVVEGKTWMDQTALFSTDIKVGNISINPKLEQLSAYFQKSVNLSSIDINGVKSIEVDISEQKMRLKMGNTIIKTFPISSGTRKTPTPTGSFKILSKQKVRIASSKPRYIMPLFMMFKSGGYGIHSLPSLANDRGVYWREALNHIGTPRSHGCIRLLPEDAQFTYDFSDVGTAVHVKW